MITCNLNGTLINCFDNKYTKEQLKEFSLNGELTCPDCGEKYEYCHGKINLPYFRHKGKIECLDYFSERETEEHIKGKTSLYKWLLSISKECGLENIRLEYYIKEARQKPDIYFEKNGKRFVIEYQCTPISTEYLTRHELYQKNGIKDIWVLGCEKYKDVWNGRRKIQVNNNHYNPKTDMFYFKNIDLVTDFKYYSLRKPKVYHLNDLSFDTNFTLNQEISNQYNIELGTLDEKENKEIEVKRLLERNKIIEKCIEMLKEAFPVISIKTKNSNKIKFAIPNKFGGKREILVLSDGTIVVYRWYIKRTWSREYYKDIYNEVYDELYSKKTEVSNLEETLLEIINKEINELK